MGGEKLTGGAKLRKNDVVDTSCPTTGASMGLFILRRLGVMLLTALCLTFIVFWLTNLYPNLEKLDKR